MSRIGQKPIPLPQGVEVALEGNRVTVRGPKGELVRSFPAEVQILLGNGHLLVSRKGEDGRHRALHGLSRSLLANMVQGVTQGFQKTLEVVGVGYRAQKVGENLVLQLGYSHPLQMVPPPRISFSVEGTNRITVSGIDKELVGDVAAHIRALRKPEPYQGKGIRYLGERIRRKAGKAGKAGGRKG